MTAPAQTVDTPAPEVSTTIPDTTPIDANQPAPDVNQEQKTETPPNDGVNPNGESKDATETNQEIPELDEAALEAIINDIVKPVDDQAKKFTFKEDAKAPEDKSQDGKPEGEKSEQATTSPDEQKILAELTQTAEIYSQENKTLTVKNQELETTVTQEREAKEEAIAVAAKVDEIWKGIAKDIPILDQYAEALGKGEAFELPAIYRPEIQQKLQDHPIVGPLNKALIAGEDLPIADFVKALAEYRRNASPQVADAKNSVPTKQTSQGNTQSKLSLHGVKTVNAF